MKTLLFDILMFLANRVVARTPSHEFRLWFYRRVMGFRIGAKSTIFMDAWLDGRHGFVMGNNSVINQRCRLDNRGGITIGDNVSISAEVCILTADHDLQSPDFAGREKPVVLEDYVFVGTRALLLPGVTVGRGAAVAAGAIVTKNVAPHTIVAGVPARPIGTRTTDLQYNLDYRRFLA